MVEKRRRSNAMPDSHMADLPETKKSKEDVVLNGIQEKQQVDLGEMDRRKRVREILKVINRRLIEKGLFFINKNI